MAIVPDNLKSAVIKSDRNEPIINEEFAAFAEFYNCAVYPARVRHPKDKALVENAVKLMYRSVYADVKGKVFHDLASLNEAILQSLDSFNRRKLTGRKESRRELFEETEKGLPAGVASETVSDEIQEISNRSPQRLRDLEQTSLQHAKRVHRQAGGYNL